MRFASFGSKAKMLKTLDEAREAFETNLATDATWQAAAEYISTAAEYWDDGVITDETFAAIVKQCVPYL